MIVLRNKQFAFGIGGMKAAITGMKGGKALTAGQRMTQGLKGVGGFVGGTALTAGAIGTAAAIPAIGATKKALTGNMGEDDGMGY
jgi:hypothetical protein